MTTMVCRNGWLVTRQIQIPYKYFFHRESAGQLFLISTSTTIENRIKSERDDLGLPISLWCNNKKQWCKNVLLPRGVVDVVGTLLFPFLTRNKKTTNCWTKRTTVLWIIIIMYKRVESGLLLDVSLCCVSHRWPSCLLSCQCYRHNCGCLPISQGIFVYHHHHHH